MFPQVFPSTQINEIELTDLKYQQRFISPVFTDYKWLKRMEVYTTEMPELTRNGLNDEMD